MRWISLQKAVRPCNFLHDFAAVLEALLVHTQDKS